MKKTNGKNSFEKGSRAYRQGRIAAEKITGEPATVCDIREYDNVIEWNTKNHVVFTDALGKVINLDYEMTNNEKARLVDYDKDADIYTWENVAGDRFCVDSDGGTILL